MKNDPKTTASEKEKMDKYLKGYKKIVKKILIQVIKDVSDRKTKNGRIQIMAELKVILDEAFKVHAEDESRFEIFWFMRFVVVKEILKTKKMKDLPDEIEMYFIDELLLSIRKPSQLLMLIKTLLPAFKSSRKNIMTAGQILFCSVKVMGTFIVKTKQGTPVTDTQKTAVKELYSLLGPYIAKAKKSVFADLIVEIGTTKPKNISNLELLETLENTFEVFISETT